MSVNVSEAATASAVADGQRTCDCPHRAHCVYAASAAVVRWSCMFCKKGCRTADKFKAHLEEAHGARTEPPRAMPSKQARDALRVAERHIKTTRADKVRAPVIYDATALETRSANTRRSIPAAEGHREVPAVSGLNGLCEYGVGSTPSGGMLEVSRRSAQAEPFRGPAGTLSAVG